MNQEALESLYDTFGEKYTGLSRDQFYVVMEDSAARLDFFNTFKKQLQLDNFSQFERVLGFDGNVGPTMQKVTEDTIRSARDENGIMTVRTKDGEGRETPWYKNTWANILGWFQKSNETPEEAEKYLKQIEEYEQSADLTPEAKEYLAGMRSQFEMSKNESSANAFRKGLVNALASTIQDVAMTSNLLEEALAYMIIPNPLGGVTVLNPSGKGIEDPLGNQIFDASKDLEEYATYQYGKQMKDWAEELFPTNPAIQGDFWASLMPQGLASALMFLGAGVGTSKYKLPASVAKKLKKVAGTVKKVPVLGGPPGRLIEGMATMAVPGGTLAMGSMSMGADAYLEALEMSGGNEQTAYEAWMWNHLIGSTESVPLGLLFGRVDKITGGGIKKVLQAGFNGSLEEALQESLSQGAQNLTAKQLYDRNRDLMQGVPEGGAAGFILGFLMNGIGASTKAWIKQNPNAALEEVEMLVKQASLATTIEKDAKERADRHFRESEVIEDTPEIKAKRQQIYDLEVEIAKEQDAQIRDLKEAQVAVLKNQLSELRKQALDAQTARQETEQLRQEEGEEAQAESEVEGTESVTTTETASEEDTGRDTAGDVRVVEEGTKETFRGIEYTFTDGAWRTPAGNIASEGRQTTLNTIYGAEQEGDVEEEGGNVSQGRTRAEFLESREGEEDTTQRTIAEQNTFTQSDIQVEEDGETTTDPSRVREDWQNGDEVTWTTEDGKVRTGTFSANSGLITDSQGNTTSIPSILNNSNSWIRNDSKTNRESAQEEVTTEEVEISDAQQEEQTYPLQIGRNQVEYKKDEDGWYREKDGERIPVTQRIATRLDNQYPDAGSETVQEAVPETAEGESGVQVLEEADISDAQDRTNLREIELDLTEGEVRRIQRTPTYEQLFTKEQRDNLKAGKNRLTVNQTVFGRLRRGDLAIGGESKVREVTEQKEQEVVRQAREPVEPKPKSEQRYPNVDIENNPKWQEDFEPTIPRVNKTKPSKKQRQGRDQRETNNWVFQKWLAKFAKANGLTHIPTEYDSQTEDGVDEIDATFFFEDENGVVYEARVATTVDNGVISSAPLVVWYGPDIDIVDEIREERGLPELKIASPSTRGGLAAALGGVATDDVVVDGKVVVKKGDIITQSALDAIEAKDGPAFIKTISYVEPGTDVVRDTDGNLSFREEADDLRDEIEDGVTEEDLEEANQMEEEATGSAENFQEVVDDNQDELTGLYNDYTETLENGTEEEATAAYAALAERANELGLEAGPVIDYFTAQEVKQAAATEGTVEEEETPRGVIGKNKKELQDIFQTVFMLEEEQAEAAAIIGDAIIGNIAKRHGVSKKAVYDAIEYRRATLQQLETENPGYLAQKQVFHGSPYSFEKFLLEKIGEGEGYQTFGWGLYFTEDSQVAEEYYARRLALAEAPDLLGTELSTENTAGIPAELLDLYAAHLLLAQSKLGGRGTPLSDLVDSVIDAPVDIPLTAVFVNKVVQKLFRNPARSRRKQKQKEALETALEKVRIGNKTYGEWVELLQEAAIEMRDSRGVSMSTISNRGFFQLIDFLLEDGNDVPIPSGVTYILASNNDALFERLKQKLIERRQAYEGLSQDEISEIQAATREEILAEFEDYGFTRAKPTSREVAILNEHGNDLLGGGFEQVTITGEEIRPEPTKAYVYEVTLHPGKNPSEYDYIEFYEKLTSNQAWKIYQVFAKEGDLDTLKDIIRQYPGNTGLSLEFRDDIIDALKQMEGVGIIRGGDGLINPKDLSLRLLRGGIDGIAYPQGALGNTPSTDKRNYVVFDESAVSIDKVRELHIALQKDAVDGDEVTRAAAVLGEDLGAIIYAITDPNVSSPIHELVHVYEKSLTEEEKQKVLKWTKEKEWSLNTTERFARGAEKFLADGAAPRRSLQGVFDKFKNWLIDIYNGITGSEIDLQLNEDMRQIYSDMLADIVSPEVTFTKRGKEVTFRKNSNGDWINTDTGNIATNRDTKKAEKLFESKVRLAGMKMRGFELKQGTATVEYGLDANNNWVKIDSDGTVTDVSASVETRLNNTYPAARRINPDPQEGNTITVPMQTMDDLVFEYKDGVWVNQETGVEVSPEFRALLEEQWYTTPNVEEAGKGVVAKLENLYKGDKLAKSVAVASMKTRPVLDMKLSRIFQRLLASDKVSPKTKLIIEDAIRAGKGVNRTVSHSEAQEVVNGILQEAGFIEEANQEEKKEALDRVFEMLKDPAQGVMTNPLGIGTIVARKLGYNYELLGFEELAAEVDLFLAEASTTIGRNMSRLQGEATAEGRLESMAQDFRQKRAEKLAAKYGEGTLDDRINAILKTLSLDEQQLKDVAKTIRSQISQELEGDDAVTDKERETAKAQALVTRGSNLIAEGLKEMKDTASGTLGFGPMLQLVPGLAKVLQGLGLKFAGNIAKIRAEWNETLKGVKVNGKPINPDRAWNMMQQESPDTFDEIAKIREDTADAVVQLIEDHYSKDSTRGLKDKIIGLGISKRVADRVAKAASREVEKKLRAQMPQIQQTVKNNKKAKRRIDPLIELASTGLLNKPDALNIIGKAYGLPVLTLKQQAKIQEMLDKRDNAPTNTAQRAAERELLTYIRRLDTPTTQLVVDFIQDAYYLNILSGFTTLARAGIGAAIGMASESLTLGVELLMHGAAPKARVKAAKRYWSREGIGAAWQLYRHVWKTGSIDFPGVADIPVKQGSQIDGILNEPWKDTFKRYTDEAVGTWETIGAYARAGADIASREILLRLSSTLYRNLIAMDAFMKAGAVETFAYSEAYIDLLHNPDIVNGSKEFHTEMERLLGLSDRQAKVEQVQREVEEGHTPANQASIRLKELILEDRDPDIAEMANERALQALLMNQNVRGILPASAVALSNYLGGTTGVKRAPLADLIRLGILRTAFPIVRVPANSVNRAYQFSALNLAGLGLGVVAEQLNKRAPERGMLKAIANAADRGLNTTVMVESGGSSSFITERISPRERMRQLARGIVGVGFNLALYGMFVGFSSDDDKEDYVTIGNWQVRITGSGPFSSYSQNKAALGQDWEPHSIQIRRKGGKWGNEIPYLDVPFLAMHAYPIGNWSDKKRLGRDSTNDIAGVYGDDIGDIAWNGLKFAHDASFAWGVKAQTDLWGAITSMQDAPVVEGDEASLDGVTYVYHDQKFYEQNPDGSRGRKITSTTFTATLKDVVRAKKGKNWWITPDPEEYETEMSRMNREIKTARDYQLINGISRKVTPLLPGLGSNAYRQILTIGRDLTDKPLERATRFHEFLLKDNIALTWILDDMEPRLDVFGNPIMVDFNLPYIPETDLEALWGSSDNIPMEAKLFEDKRNITLPSPYDIGKGISAIAPTRLNRVRDRSQKEFGAQVRKNEDKIKELDGIELQVLIDRMAEEARKKAYMAEFGTTEALYKQTEFYQEQKANSRIRKGQGDLLKFYPD